MVRAMRMTLVSALALAFVACGNGVETPPGNDDELAVCLQGEPFIDSGAFPLEPPLEPADAAQVSDLRWEAHEGCERFVIDLAASDGSPADSPGDVEVRVLRDLGIVRIELHDVDDLEAVELAVILVRQVLKPDATETTPGSDLLEAAYTVLSTDGWIEVDLHLADAAEVHVATLLAPARVVVDLRPGGASIPPPAARGDRVVVVEPREGDETYPLTVTGYARTFEANVVVRIEQDGEEVFEDFTTATAWVDAWGAFTFEIDDGPSGDIELHVGEYSARDGTWQGVMVELTMRS